MSFRNFDFVRGPTENGSIPAPGSFDKSRVLDVKPLRCLAPIFPSAPGSSTFPPQPPHFVSAAPSGPFPPGFTPFYPFSVPPESQKPSEQSPRTPVAVPNQAGHFGLNNPISTAVPITSFRTPTTAANGDFSLHIDDEEGEGVTLNERKARSQKRPRGGQRVNLSSPDVDIESVISSLLSTYSLTDYDARRVNGDKESVDFSLTIFNLLRRKISQIEEAKEALPGVTRRPDLRAATLLMKRGVRANVSRRIGPLPGIEVGDIFFFRMEMCLVGLHAPSMAGIDYTSVKFGPEEEPLAVSIVSSGGYEDDVEDGNVLLYSGQGGNIYKKDKEVVDQKLVRGNLALEKSLHRANEVRVIRGVKDFSSPGGKVYVYDGLYKIQDSWVEKGKSGCNVFKYKLIRVPGQPEAFMRWKTIQQWKDGVTSRDGLILPDLTSGAENIPVSLVNDVDDEKGPAYFNYFPTLKFTELTNPLKLSPGCSCKGGCQPVNHSCLCLKKNGDYVPYTSTGFLVDSNAVIHECAPTCPCPPNCRNRVSQAGLKVYLEVFKTKNKGWGLRSWDPIRVGSFVCEYAGEVISRSITEDIGYENEDDYIFDASRSYMLPEFMRADSVAAQKIPFSLVISAKNAGNVSRFMNHSCSPNVFWRPVYRGSGSESDFHVAFYAIKHIPPMTELTYDYGIIESNNAGRRRKTCNCGSLKCRGYFY